MQPIAVPVLPDAAAVASTVVESQAATPVAVLAFYVRQALDRHPQVLQSEAESRAAENRAGEAAAAFTPRLSIYSTLAREVQKVTTTRGETTFSPAWGQLRLTAPVYDKSLTAQLNQRKSAIVGADWKLTDTREQLMLRTVEAYIELARSTNLVRLAQDNLKAHRQYLGQIKEIALADLGRAGDIPAAAGRVALAESVLTNRLNKLESSRVVWRQLTGQSATALGTTSDMQAPEALNLPMVRLPDSVDQVVDLAYEFNPAIQAAKADIETARLGVDVAQAPFKPRITLEASAKAGSDWGGTLGNQTDQYIGVSLEWAAFAGRTEHYATKSAYEGELSAHAALSRARDEVRSRVEHIWFDMQSNSTSLRSFENYAQYAAQMVESTRNQFKIGRRSLLDVLNAESELFTARSNIESTLQDLTLSAWRLHSMQGRLQAELGMQ